MHITGMFFGCLLLGQALDDTLPPGEAFRSPAPAATRIPSDAPQSTFVQPTAAYGSAGAAAASTPSSAAVEPPMSTNVPPPLPSSSNASPSSVPSSASGASAKLRIRPPEMVAEAAVLPSGGPITGKPLTLVEALSVSVDRRQQMEIVRGYWALVQAVGDYRYAAEHWRALASLKGRGGSDAILQPAQTAAAAQVREAELSVLRLQYDLASAMNQAANVALPLPADRPHVGAYRTYFNELFAGRTAPEQARLAEKTLPILRQMVDEQAASVQAAEDVLSVGVEEFSGGRSEAASVVVSARELLARRRAFIAAVCSYNRTIADYGMSVAMPTATPQTLASMLISPPQTAGNSGVQTASVAQPPMRSYGANPATGSYGQQPIRTAVRNQPTLANPATRPEATGQSYGAPATPSDAATTTPHESTPRDLAPREPARRSSSEPAPSGDSRNASSSPTTGDYRTAPPSNGDYRNTPAAPAADYRSPPPTSGSDYRAAPPAPADDYRSSTSASDYRTTPPSATLAPPQAKNEPTLAPPREQWEQDRVSNAVAATPAKSEPTLAPPRETAKSGRASLGPRYDMAQPVNNEEPVAPMPVSKPAARSRSQQEPPALPEDTTTEKPLLPADDRAASDAKTNQDSRATLADPIPRLVRKPSLDRGSNEQAAAGGGAEVSSLLYPALVDATPAVRAKQLTVTLHWDRVLPANAGKSMSLADCLWRDPNADKRPTIEAFWTVRQRAAEYQLLAGETDFYTALMPMVLERRSDPTGASDMLRLQSAQLAAQAMMRQKHVALIESQYALAMRIGMLADPAWPLASTIPHSGSYQLKLEAQPRGVAESWAIRRLAATIPVEGETLQQRATAVVQADAARVAATESYQAGRASLDSVLMTIEAERDATTAFLDSLTQYNRSIADYALGVLPAGASADKIVTALVVKS